MFGLSVVADAGGVKARVDPIFALMSPPKAGECCSEFFDSGVVARKRARLGVGAGRREDVSESRSLLLP